MNRSIVYSRMSRNGGNTVETPHKIRSLSEAACGPGAAAVRLQCCCSAAAVRLRAAAATE